MVTTAKTKSADEFVQYGFGPIFETTARIIWDKKNGWMKKPQLVKKPRKLAIHPNSHALHYGGAIFEGMVALLIDGRVGVFRLDDHLDRMNNAAKRLGMPEIPRELFVQVIAMIFDEPQLINALINNEYPSIYLRPDYINTTVGFDPEGVSHCTLILSASGLNNPPDRKPMNVLLKSDKNVAGPCIDMKFAGNYAPRILATQEAKKNGFQNILWYDPAYDTIQELNTNNIFVCTGDYILTPECNGKILPGITRKTIIEKASPKYKVIEERITLNRLFDLMKNPDNVEIFATGTASEAIRVYQFIHDGFPDFPYISNSTRFTEEASGWIRDARHDLSYMTIVRSLLS